MIFLKCTVVATDFKDNNAIDSKDDALETGNYIHNIKYEKGTDFPFFQTEISLACDRKVIQSTSVFYLCFRRRALCRSVIFSTCNRFNRSIPILILIHIQDMITMTLLRIDQFLSHVRQGCNKIRINTFLHEFSRKVTHFTALIVASHQSDLSGLFNTQYLSFFSNQPLYRFSPEIKRTVT